MPMSCGGRLRCDVNGRMRKCARGRVPLLNAKGRVASFLAVRPESTNVWYLTPLFAASSTYLRVDPDAPYLDYSLVEVEEGRVTGWASLE